MMNSKIRLDPLGVTAYLTLIGVTAFSLWEINRILLRWLILGLLVAFGILQSQLPAQFSAKRERMRANAVILLQFALVAGMLVAAGLNYSLVILFFILSVNAMIYNPFRWGLALLVAFTLTSGWFFYTGEGLNSSLRGMTIFAAGYLFFGVVANALAQARIAQLQNNLLLNELRSKNLQLEDYARQVEVLVAVEERNRLAREVHDTIGHRLTAAAVQLEGAQRLIAADPEKAAGMVGASRQQVREALQDLRQTVGRLREPVEIELSLPQALRRLAGNFQDATGLKIQLEIGPGAHAYSPAQRLALYRAAQEGLTNVHRHAAASQAWLRLSETPGQVSLQVLDNGKGFEPNNAPSSFGLRGLRERAAQLGGTVNITARPEGGSALTIQLPVQENNV